MHLGIVLTVLLYSLCASSSDPNLKDGPPNHRTAKACDTNKDEQCPLWITQKLDHFDDQNMATWQMKYYALGNNYKPGGPLFIVVGGQYSVNGYQKALMYKLAEETNGYLFYTEHRFYGESRPTSDLSIENLQFLSVDQAIFDLVVFINVQRSTIPGAQNSDVIVSGCGYAGTIATWLKQHYPDKVAGVWASSAPLRALMDFNEYKRVVSATYFKIGKADCYNRVKMAFEKLEQKFASGQVADLKRLFGLCQHMDAEKKLDVQYFLFVVSNVLSQVGQHFSPDDISSACAVINDPELSDPVEAVGVLFQRRFGQSPCTDITSDRFINLYSNRGWDMVSPSPLGYSRPYIYQSCNELGWFRSSSAVGQIFGSGFPIELHVELCQALFGSRFTKNFMKSQLDKTNERSDYFHLNNVFSTFGELDPWAGLDVQERIGYSGMIKDHGQCSEQFKIPSSNSSLFVVAKKWVTIALNPDSKSIRVPKYLTVV